MEEDLDYQDIIDTFRESLSILGINIEQVEIHYRGFGSQGDGASFDFKLLTLKEVSAFLKAIRFVPPGDGNIEYIINEYFEAFDIYTSKNSFSTIYCHEKTRDININHQYKDGHTWELLIKEAERHIIDWYVEKCKEFYKQLENRFDEIQDHEKESERLDPEMAISDKIDSMIDSEMNIEKIVEMIKEANTISSSYKEEEELISKFIENFNENFKIVPKEEFGVIYNSGDAGRKVTGGFHSEKEAERFKDEWNQKQDEYIEEVLAKNPDADINCSTYLTVGKIEPIKKEYLEWFKFDYELKEVNDATNKKN